MEDKKPACAYIFNRNVVYKDEYTTVYRYFPMETANGSIVDIDGERMFVTRSVKALKGVKNTNKNPDTKQFEFSFMGDTSNLGETYVYGFPLYLIDENDNSRRLVASAKKEMNDLLEDIASYGFYQAVNKDDSFDKIFLVADDYKISVDPAFYDDLFKLSYGITVDKIDEAIDATTEYHDEEEYEEEQESQLTPHAIIVKPENYLFADELYNHITKTVKCQDDQVRFVSTLLAKNSRIPEPDLKSTLLLCGPTGCGKTEIFRTIQQQKIIPVTIEDANEYSAVSLQGKDTIEMLAHLVIKANGNVELAQRGIIVVDEIDKKVDNASETATYTTAVIDALLKMMEGHEYIVPMNRDEKIIFNTSQLTFAFLGACSGIEKYANVGGKIGFVTQEQKEQKIKDIYNDASLKKYGFKPEFLGRCDIAALKQLDEEDLIRIITTSDKSQLLLYKYLLETMNVDFIYDDKTIEAIAKKAVKMGAGARSIRKIVDEALAIANFYLFSKNNYKQFIISPETIEDPHAYILK